MYVICRIILKFATYEELLKLTNMTLTQQDKDLLIKKGISEEKLAEELACFEHGFPYLKLYAVVI